MIVVTGATGKLGQQVIEQLLKKVPAKEIVAAVRSPEKAKAWSDQGVQVRRADYSKPETLDAALAGATQVVLISSNEMGQREPQHLAVLAAAKRAGVKLLVYTSILGGEATKMQLAGEHIATEKAIRASGVPYVFLRNGWYFENQTDNLAPALAHGVILGSAGTGKLSYASRADYAAAIVAVVTEKGHENKAYELAGDQGYTVDEVAKEVARQSGKPVVYQDLPEADYAKALAGFGLPAAFAGILADSDTGARRGELHNDSHQLSKLIGRPTTSLADAVKAGLAKK